MVTQENRFVASPKGKGEGKRTRGREDTQRKKKKNMKGAYTE